MKIMKHIFPSTPINLYISFMTLVWFLETQLLIFLSFITYSKPHLTPFFLIQTSGTVELPALVNSPSSRGTSASPKPLPKAPGSKSSSPSPSTANKNTTSTANTSATATVSSATQDLLGLGECNCPCNLGSSGLSQTTQSFTRFDAVTL